MTASGFDIAPNADDAIDDVDMEKLRAKYSRPREQLVAEANAKGYGNAEPNKAFGQSDALADIVMCQACGAMGTVKKQYGYRVIDEQCDICGGEGVIKKGLAKKASDELKAKCKRVEALVEQCEDLDELEKLEEALSKKTAEALNTVLAEYDAKEPPLPPTTATATAAAAATTDAAAVDVTEEEGGGGAATSGDVVYATALKQHLTAALNEILTSQPEDPFKAMQKILFQASLGDGSPPEVEAVSQTPAMAEYMAKFDLETHVADVIAKKGTGSGPMSGVKFMISDAGDVFTELSKLFKAGGGKPLTAEELKAMDAAAAKAKREKEAKEQAERDLKDAENAKRAAELEASGKKATGGLHKFDASEVDVHGGDATADDFLDAFGF